MFLDAPLDYARNGWSVLPLNGKAPYTKHGVDDATTDPDKIRSWWTRWPDANIGCRVPEQVVVLDIDPRNGGSTDALFPGVDPSLTLTCCSGRCDGGMHLYYLRPVASLSSTRLPKGIDLKLNGYMVMPPSLHPDTGRPYTWYEHPVVPLPAHLLELLRVRPPVPRPMVRRGNSKGLVEFVAGQNEGNRNKALYWAACRAVTEGTLDQLGDTLVNAAVAAGESERQARRTIESARGKAGAV